MDSWEGKNQKTSSDYQQKEEQDDPIIKEIKQGKGVLKATYLTNSEAAMILNGKLEKLKRKRNSNMTSASPQILTETVEYLKRVSVYDNPDAVRQVWDFLSRHGLTDYELCQFGNLMPESVDEARALIPSLNEKRNTCSDEDLEKMINNVALIREFQ